MEYPSTSLDNSADDNQSPQLDPQTAADLIRQKVAQIYAEEPNARQELAEADVVTSRSKHQEFMHQLSTSGRSLAEIQTAWHNYYVNLPDTEKHEVWREFYASNTAASQYGHFVSQPSPQSGQQLAAHKNKVAEVAHTPRSGRKVRPLRSTAELREGIRDKISAGGKLKAKHHVQSLLFGLGMGFIVVFIFMFTFFNEVFLTPFIQPSRHAAATPIILGTDNVAPTTDPEVIIPKINVEIPVNYSETSTDEATIENDLKDGIVHYPTTSLPGQNGNTAFFGHSSNNIFNKGKYKFAFVLLHELVPGDVFYLTNNGKVYAYKVFSKTVVEPSEVGVLDPVEGHTATATLITCDPPGTSLHRLVVVGDQISPDPTGNGQSTALAGGSSSAISQIVGNGPTLWTRWWGTGYGKTVTFLTLGILAVAFFRKMAPRSSATGLQA
jgi:LPXTG-site transpeptidase (sortase) family protein